VKVLAVTGPRGGQELGESAARIAVGFSTMETGASPLRVALVDLDANGFATRLLLGPHAPERVATIQQVASGERPLSALLNYKTFRIVQGRGLDGSLQVELAIVRSDTSLRELEAGRPTLDPHWLQRSIRSLEGFDIVVLATSEAPSLLAKLAQQSSDMGVVLVAATPHIKEHVHALARWLDRDKPMAFLLATTRLIATNEAHERLRDALKAENLGPRWSALESHLAPVDGYRDRITADSLAVASELAQRLTPRRSFWPFAWPGDE
jgi:hypothetical protein